MARNGSGVYSKPVTSFVAGTTIESGKINTLFDDLVTDANLARPLTAGGTGGSSQITGWDGLTAKGTDVASASTINLTTATGPRVDITGTTTITAVTLANGSWRLARATGIFTLTASASLIVNKSTSVNYTTAVGDLLIFTAEGGVTSVTAITSGGLSTSNVATSAQYQANTASKVLDTSGVWGAMAATALTPGTTVSWDMSTGIDFTLAPVQNFTLSNPTNTQAGKRGRIKITQDGTGSRTFTKSSNMKTANGVAIVLSTAAGAIDYIDYDCVSATEIRLSLSKAWA